MVPLRLALALVATAACYQQDASVYETFPEPTYVAGPPGGEMDPAYGPQPYTDGSQPSADGYADGYADSSQPYATVDGAAYPDAHAGAGYATAAVSDAEIEAALAAYGEWIFIEDYGWVWRPYATEVGVDFTPYETCGSWVWTDWGWTFACEWDWGWLAFHYGRWGWFDDYWAWQPGYEWSPACVEWRSGGGYVGWRPLEPIIRDHRGEHRGPRIRDHRTGSGPIVRDHRRARSRNSHWRFTAVADLGKSRIRPHLFKRPAHALDLTKQVSLPPRGDRTPVDLASIMRGRHANRAHGIDSMHPGRGGGARRDARPAAPTWHRPDRQWSHAASPSRGRGSTRPSMSPGAPDSRDNWVHQPTWTPDRAHSPPSRGTIAPQPDRSSPHTSPPGTPPGTGPALDRTSPPTFDPGGAGVRPPADDSSRPPRTHAPPTWSPHQPDRDIAPPSSSSAPTWTPPSRQSAPPTWSPSRAPDRDIAPPSGSSSPPTWSPPSRQSSPPTWSPSRAPDRDVAPPSRSSAPPSWSPPSRSSAPPASWSPPSRSSSPPTWSPSRAPDRDVAPPSRSSAPSWSPPSRSLSSDRSSSSSSSSSSSPSRSSSSSSSWSSPSRSSNSSSSSSSSSRSSSSGWSSGSRSHRR